MSLSYAVRFTQEERQAHPGHMLVVQVSKDAQEGLQAFCEDCRVPVGTIEMQPPGTGFVLTEDALDIAARQRANVVDLQEKYDALLKSFSRALDEVYALRSLCAYEAQIIETDLGYKTFPKSRREIAEKRVERLRAVAKGFLPSISHLSLRHAREAAGMPQLLTRAQWEAEHG